MRLWDPWAAPSATHCYTHTVRGSTTTGPSSQQQSYFWTAAHCFSSFTITYHLYHNSTIISQTIYLRQYYLIVHLSSVIYLSAIFIRCFTPVSISILSTFFKFLCVITILFYCTIFILIYHSTSCAIFISECDTIVQCFSNIYLWKVVV